MVCVGAIGLTSAPGGRVGSTAVELATWAHCPVAIIRGVDPSPAQPTSIVVEVDSSSDGDVVLQRGIDEALLRHAPLVVISVGPPHPIDLHDGGTVTEQNHQAATELDRRLTRATRRHPGLEVRPVAEHAGLLDQLASRAGTVQLIVVGRRRPRGIAEIVGPLSDLTLHGTDCSVLVCDPRNPL
jgi:nucleotide-binding universal stress UspA family protein